MQNPRLKIAVTVLGILVVCALSSVASAQTEVALNYSWSAPVGGSPVDHYVVQHSVDGGAWTQVGTASTTSFTLNASIGHSHRIRVAGVDAQDRQGPYSDPSDAHTPDLGPPGQPGQPVLF